MKCTCSNTRKRDVCGRVFFSVCGFKNDNYTTEKIQAADRMKQILLAETAFTKNIMETGSRNSMADDIHEIEN